MVDFTPTVEQRAILAHDPRQHARILAGPGTGKSATVVAFVEKLIAEEVSPRIKLVTFTRAATGELAKKIADRPSATTDHPSTIHSFAISLLLRNPGAGGFPEPLRIADRWEKNKIINKSLALRARVTMDLLKDKLLPEMSANWETLNPVRFPEVDEITRTRFLGAWHEHRGIYGYTLLSELPYALRRALYDHPDFNGLDYDLLVVDEYQDLNACDIEVVSLVSQRGCVVVSAGDDDQSIYGRLRRADPEGIRRFPQDYPGSADYTLSVTQRCGRRIIEWANHIIRGDPDRPIERAVLASADGAPDGEVALLAFRGEVSEAIGVASLVRGLIEREQVPPSEILVLLRSDWQGHFSRTIRQYLEALHIPCFDPETVYLMLEEPSNRRMIEIFRLATRREDAIAWASLLELTRGIGDAFNAYIYNRALAAHVRFGQALLAGHPAGFPGAPVGAAKKACQMMEAVLAWLDAHQVPETPDDGWGRWIVESAGGNVVPAPTEELAQLLIALDARAEPEQDLARYIGQIEPLGRDLRQSECDGVRIMSMVASKGLTVRATIIAAVEEGVIPRPNQDLAEERRLLYVAMTRAKEYLYCTWAGRRRGPTARAGLPAVGRMRRSSMFLDGGPVRSQDGQAFLRQRFPG